jgi:putative membrane protein
LQDGTGAVFFDRCDPFLGIFPIVRNARMPPELTRHNPVNEEVKMLRTLCLAVAALLVAVPVPVNAQTPNQPAAKAGGTGVDAETRQFVEKAAIGDMFEIQSSKLALDKSDAKELDDFARHIVDDHTKSSEKLKSIVGNVQGLQIPQQLDSKHRDMLGQLQNASGQQFHQLYRKQQIDAHQEAVQLFETYSKKGQNKELQEFASSTLPTLKEHLEKAQGLPERMQGQTVGQAPQQGQQQAQQPPREPAQSQSQQGGPSQRTSLQPISKPGTDHILASDLEGTSVYGSDNENIGEIDDVVLDRKGRVVAVIVGVGGFLGIGEKSVAIPFEALEIAAAGQGRTAGGDRQGATQTSQGPQSEKGSKGTIEPQRIVLRGMTRQDLEKAPAFDAGSDNTDSPRR